MLTERQVAIVALAGGAKDITLPTLSEAFNAYEQALTAEPEQIDPERLELLRAMGVR